MSKNENSRGENIFVFVVCGSRTLIESLHFSMKALRKYSAIKIVVLTDTSRNEIGIEHADIIDVKAPSDFTDHQASIFLKTAIHKYLPIGNNYCYLDTDVIALNKQADKIFEHFKPPVTFCTDITRLNKFSHFAVVCDCLKNFDRDKLLPALYEKEFDETVLPDIKLIDRSVQEIEKRIASTKRNKLVYRWHRLKYAYGGKFYRLDGDYMLEKSSGVWYTTAGKKLKYEGENKDVVVYIQNKTGFNFNPATNQWYRKDGTSVSELFCNHLNEFIKTKFGISIFPPDWQHWNGGVFLFNEQSHPFLNYWHEITMEVFKDNNWTTRDQGTLAAAVWKFSLQNHYTLPLSFNFIVGKVTPIAYYLGNLQFKTERGEQIITPDFIHVYKNWGDMNWPVWKDIVQHISNDAD